MSPNPRPIRIDPVDDATEREALGHAMTGTPLPPWLTEAHFAAGWNARVFRAIRELEPDCSLPRVAAWIRDEPGAVQTNAKVQDLALMVTETGFAARQGWAGPDYDRLKELELQRRLLKVITECDAMVRAGRWDSEMAKGKLIEVFF